MGPFLPLSPEFFYLLYGPWHLLGPKLIKKKKKLSAAKSDVCITPRTVRINEALEAVCRDSGVTPGSGAGDRLRCHPAVCPSPCTLVPAP